MNVSKRIFKQLPTRYDGCSMCCSINKYLHVRFGFALLLLISVTAFLSKQELSNQCLGRSEFSNKTKHIVALVLARGGSKGIPYKNLAKVAGVSLLGRALRVIHNCRNCFHEVWVSTDNELIAQEARHYNANVHYRSEYSARDEATSIESILEFLNGHSYIQNVALIQCTSVFIYEQYLETAVKRFKRKRHIDCVFSVHRSFKLRWKQMTNSKRLMPLNFNPNKRPRRQDWSGELVETGMFYFAKKHLIEIHGLLQNNRCEFVEIDDQHVLEIDTKFHLDLANILADD